MILSKALLMNLLTMGITAGDDDVDPLLLGAKAILIASNITIDKDTLLADIAVPTFTGYAASSALEWSGPTLSNQTGLPAIRAAAKEFTVTDNEDNERVYGYAIVNSAADTLLASELFDESFVPEADTVIEVTARLGLQEVDVSPQNDLTLS